MHLRGGGFALPDEIEAYHKRNPKAAKVQFKEGPNASHCGEVALRAAL